MNWKHHFSPLDVVVPIIGIANIPVTKRKFFPYADKYARSIMDLVALYVSHNSKLKSEWKFKEIYN